MRTWDGVADTRGVSDCRGCLEQPLRWGLHNGTPPNPNGLVSSAIRSGKPSSQGVGMFAIVNVSQKHNL